MAAEYREDTLAEMDGRPEEAGTSDWLRWWRSEDASESEAAPREGRPVDDLDESWRACDGCGLAPPGLFTRLFRRSAR